MQKLTILNTREIKKIREIMLQQFGFFPSGDYAFLQNEKDRLFIVNKDLARIDTGKLKIDRVGLYFAETKPNHLRLSKEGAQFLMLEAGKESKKVQNVIALDEEETEHYFAGEDLEKDRGKENMLVILQHKHKTIGCAAYKDGRIINYLPKIYRRTVIV